ncbi:D-alanyl-D-alanine carboxypeptidase/D-alanyl-D-alanine-endopeptidase [Comamonas sp.]|uniref:D-alanyl-D-alanine carboxypeptidase/D-alanyl-D-alanine endopeptidase n=1 Tax=Comamonas sp. TaxID=34028 RepID=UPI00289AC608|nr:D-alanyl-D-alanine carboxypeptidase/D-alanyl-D-alanine-endopeptidase [Comamonas sp.]
MFQTMMWRSLRRSVASVALAGAGSVLAQSVPAPVEAALARAQIARDALSLYVAPVEGRQPARLTWQATQAMNPASVMKLVTTYAALEQLGPTYVWRTPVYLDGVVDNGAFRGTVYIKGAGDPKLVSERLWLMLGRLQGMGVKVIVGDIVVDRSAFQVQGHDAAAFDGEPFKPYNAGPDALLINYKTQVLGFIPDVAAGVARIHYELPMGQLQAPLSVPLAPPGAACGDWRTQLQADWSDPQRIQLQGRYPASCGDKNWAVALPDPNSFALKAVEGMWRSMGGQLTGSVRDGVVPAGLKPAWENQSPALAEVVRDINKYSNNVMTQQVLLTMGKERMGVGSLEAGRTALAQWWQLRWPAAEMPLVDNGAGLSRNARISAQALGRMLQAAWGSSVMPEFVASMPISGMDGTLRRSKASANAHLKTGSLRDTNALAGYVHGNSGQRYVLVALINHPNAGAARPVMDALVDWVAQD